MSFNIIIRSGNSPRFKPHFNRELVDKANPHGQMIHTKEDYLKEMKKRGLEPYRPDEVKRPASKKYTPSKECREIVNYVEKNKKKDGTVQVPTKIMDFIQGSSGNKKERKIKGNTSKGGFEA